MNVFRIASIFAASLLLAATVLADDGIRIVYSEPVQLIGAVSADAQSPDGAERMLRFNALDRRFDVALSPNYTILDALPRGIKTDSVAVYRGSLEGVPDSWARVTMHAGVPQGMIWDGREMFALEASEQDPSQAIIYRLSDLAIEPGALSCMGLGGVRSGEQLLTAMTREMTDETMPDIGRAVGATSQIQVGLVSDSLFFDRSLGDPVGAMLARMNIVDGIFSDQVGVQLTIDFIDDSGPLSDPFTDTTVAGDLLEEVRDYRFDSPEQSATGLTHLFTGRDLDSTTAGIAYIGALCSRSFGVALTQATRGTISDALIAAHEFGHNFGAEHDGEAGSVCESTPETFLMAPRLSNSNQFSDCSLTTIQPEVARASCLSSLDSVDVSVQAEGDPGQATVGESGSTAFAITSNGTQSINDVSIEITIPTTVTLDSVTSGTGSCTSGAGTATCDIGTLAPGSGTTVTVAATADSVGPQTFDAVVSGTDDQEPDNNTAQNRIIYDPIADLQITIDSVNANVTSPIDTSVLVVATAQNLSPDPAFQVQLTVTPGAGLRVDTARWSPGICEVANGVATCDANSVDAQSSDPVRIGFTGTSTGVVSYTMALTSITADNDTANNQLTGQITVTSAPVQPAVQDGGGGGGGAINWWLLALLGGSALGRMRQSRDNAG